MKIQLLFLIGSVLCFGIEVHAQQYTGIFKTVTGNTDYHHFTRDNANGAAVYINQVGSGPVLRLSSGTAAANQNVNFTVENNGNVGIGTTTPDAKLTVKGNIHTREVKVDLAGSVAPDYVFKEDYPLRSLEEVQAHIKERGHLPGIPSAKEMEEEGIHIKEMNLKLLEKVEELTLYTIQLKEENDLLRRRVDRLEVKTYKK